MRVNQNPARISAHIQSEVCLPRFQKGCLSLSQDQRSRPVPARPCGHRRQLVAGGVINVYARI